jgi:hypothetical protein
MISIYSESVVTPEFRLSFPNVLAPAEDKDGKAGKYSITMCFEKETMVGENIKWFENIINDVKTRVSQTVYGGKPIPTAVQTNPMKDGDVPNTMGNVYHEGFYTLTATTKRKPDVFHARKDADGRFVPITDAAELYAGCVCRAKVRAFWWDISTKRGISLNFSGVIKICDADPFASGSTRAKTEEDFSAFVTESAPVGSVIAPVSATVGTGSILNI